MQNQIVHEKDFILRVPGVVVETVPEEPRLGKKAVLEKKLSLLAHSQTDGDLWNFQTLKNRRSDSPDFNESTVIDEKVFPRPHKAPGVNRLVKVDQSSNPEGVLDGRNGDSPSFKGV